MYCSTVHAHRAESKGDISRINELTEQAKHQQRASGRVTLVETLNSAQTASKLEGTNPSKRLFEKARMLECTKNQTWLGFLIVPIGCLNNPKTVLGNLAESNVPPTYRFTYTHWPFLIGAPY